MVESRPQPTASATRIIGIDPGLRNMGWGIVDVFGASLRFVASGTIQPSSKLTLAERLCALHEALTNIMHEHMPHEAAVENTFVNKDAAGTLKLGQARGIALLVPAQAGVPVSEYAPNAVKKTVIGVGHGDKSQIKLMVKVLLPRASFDTDDAADALAIALCHAQQRGRAALEARIAGAG
ncbi:MAG: crossover junction endodeoxyribonuclease RuvC [Pseudomonadota bacterium]